MKFGTTMTPSLEEYPGENPLSAKDFQKTVSPLPNHESVSLLYSADSFHVRPATFEEGRRLLRKTGDFEKDR